MKQKFDGYAEKYDSWFMTNEKLFNSELLLLKKVLGDVDGKRILSVGCGSGLFERLIGHDNIEGLEPSEDMAEIAEKRGIHVIAHCTVEQSSLQENAYDIIYFNGSSSYISDLKTAYGLCKKALKPGGKLILLDVPKESAFGFMYLLAKAVGTFDHEYLKDVMPALPYPIELVNAGIWHSTEEKIQVLKELGYTGFEYYQTLLNNPMYTNDEVEEVVEGYTRGGYVAVIAHRQEN